jgi:membrane associated rhomboid family serine protease
MLDDRHYMREAPDDSGEDQWSATLLLLIVIVISYVFQVAFEHDRLAEVKKYLYLSREGIQDVYLWQLISFQFLHGNLGHLVLNLIGIYGVGRELESTLGKGSFLKLYFGSGVAGGVLHVACAFVWKDLDVPVVGASAGACGLLAAFAALYWRRSIHLFVFSVPVTFTGRGFLFFNLALGALLWLFFGNRLAHAAHAGGMLAGLYYVFGILHGNPWGAWASTQPPARRPRVLVRAAAARQEWEQPKPVEVPEEEELPPAEFIAREVDPILDKINAHGIKSLTERELKVLQKARQKIRKP